ncbi:GMC oxidoreductase [Novosphingobium kaempferiae]|uniref:GMC oxidoreductase n=1 Tax=Novosphingobium kaempferiae TaxID=2896849 RepID=UPI001E37E5F9|nr:GMC family oxidoreductase [Novosphingobium kaempferiae]
MIGALAARHWDVIVIGTGIGGGVIGRRLAERGLSILFVEKGRAGYRTEENHMPGDEVSDPVARLARGSWPEPVRARIEGQERRFHAAIGAGVGGSSVFYAATLERPEVHDLDHSEERPHPTAGWPVRFAEMLPYFDQAQALFSIRGEPDPLASHPTPSLAAPARMCEGDARLMAGMRRSGLHPYQLHSAMLGVEGCGSCLGRKCPRPCKMDGRSAGVEPAVATGRAAVADRCEVKELIGGNGRITQVVASRDGEDVTFTGDHVVLAAGALSSPRILLGSRSSGWSEGCGNARGQVGRNLMFHLNEMFALWPRRGEGYDEAAKSIGFRDLYHADGHRFGMVQAMGLDAGEGEILSYLRGKIDRTPLRRVPGAKELARIPAKVAAQMLGQAKVFVGLLEDMPYAENRVMPDPERPGGILVDYRFSPELHQRRKRFRKLIRSSLGQRTLFLTYEPVLNFGHPCGSLRMGTDPEKSVVDARCRVHGMTNLWVADASFMPTSMGVNPSLTIAANALRVGDAIMAAA